MNPILFRLLWSKRKLFLIGSGLVLNLKPTRKKIIYCEEVEIVEILKIKPPDINGRRSGILEIIGILRKHLLLTMAAAGTALLAAVMSILSPLYISKLIDSIAENLNSTGIPTNFTGNAEMLLGISLCNAILTALYIKLIGDLGERIAGDMRVDLFEKLLHETVTYFDDHQVGELLSRLSVDVKNFKHSLKQILTTGIRAGVQLSASAVQMCLLSQSLTLSLGSSLPLIFVVGNVYGQFLRSLSVKARESEAAASNRAHEALINIRTVKSFVAEDYETKKFSNAIEEQQNIQSDLLGHVGIFQGLTSFSMNSLLAAVLYLGGLEVISGNLSRGGLLAFLMSLQTAQKSLTQFVTLNAKWHSMLSDHERITKTVHSKDELEDLHSGIVPEEPSRGRIEIKDVTFAHQSRGDLKIFDSADLKISENEIIGIIGESGSGKSTLISLLSRFYDPEKGQFFIDGVDAKEVDLKWLRKQLGIVPQEPVLFTGTIQENIAYGFNEFSIEEIKIAAEKAHIHDFISNLPQGYSTSINKCSLSGGQKQRIAIARVLLRNPQILILDEATSALDHKSEVAIHETIKEIIKEGKTVIIITHKKEILEMANRVYTFKNGKFDFVTTRK